MRLQNKVAVITGAASGMGLAMATRFAAEGARIVAGDWHGERLDSAVSEIKKSGGTIVAARGNIAEQSTAEALVDLAISSFGRIDILCNNAGVMDHLQGVAELSDEIWRRILSINLDGPMYTTRRAVPHMIAQGGGSIINMGSIASSSGATAGVAYTVAKHGIIGLTRQTAWHYAKQGVRCNAICPGAVYTNIMETMPADQLDPIGSKRLMEFMPLTPAVLDASDVAALALFLASDESRYINAAIIPADGGWKAC
jgi:NAD(P)-dependent dehydrogenase (short-subunit alcohol dehydrogenase family)